MTDMHCLLGKSHETGQDNVMVIFEGYIESPHHPKNPRNVMLHKWFKIVKFFSAIILIGL